MSASNARNPGFQFPNLCILGVGHSGTSIITKMLFALGYKRKGCDDQYCENVAFRTLHAVCAV